MYKSNKIEYISLEGVNLPNKALTNFELLAAVKKLNIPNFRGVLMRNDLPRRPLKRECGILNLDNVSGIMIMITFTSIPLGFNLLKN